MPYTQDRMPDQEPNPAPDKRMLADQIQHLYIILLGSVIVFAALGWLLVASLLEIRDNLAQPRPLDVHLDAPSVVVTVEPYIVVYPGPFNIYPEP